MVRSVIKVLSRISPWQSRSFLMRRQKRRSVITRNLAVDDTESSTRRVLIEPTTIRRPPIYAGTAPFPIQVNNEQFIVRTVFSAREKRDPDCWQSREKRRLLTVHHSHVTQLDRMPGHESSAGSWRPVTAQSGDNCSTQRLCHGSVST
jgi:hypothetical protein